MHRLAHRLAVFLCLGAFACGASEPPFVEPPVITPGDNGWLRLTLTPKYSEILLDETKRRTRVYAGAFSPPTWQVARGGIFAVTLNNELPEQPTNLHFDGMSVTPIDNDTWSGDDVFASVEPGASRFYFFRVPADHPAGIFSYRAAPFGLTAGQVGNGMAGAIVVTGSLDAFPQLAGLSQRMMVLKDVQYAADGSLLTPPDTGATTVLTVNGLVRPRLKAQPGEMQLWNILNASADLYYRISLAGHTLHELARDGNLHTRLVARQSILLPPSARTQVLISAADEGEYLLTAARMGNQPPDFEEFFAGASPLYSAGACAAEVPVNTTGCSGLAAETCMGPQGPCLAGGTLLTLWVKGDRVLSPQLPSDDQFPAVSDLRDTARCRRRVVNLQASLDGQDLFINDQPFDSSRIDFEVDLAQEEDCVEEWQINNCTGENHVFHIGQVDFQVIEVDGVASQFLGYQDTVNVPFRDCDRFREESSQCQSREVDERVWPLYSCPTDDDPRGRVVVRIPFTPVSAGKFTFQCAEAGHADNGMMGVVEVCGDGAVACSGDLDPGTDPDDRDPVTPGRDDEF
ncbi:MAG: multicopper oxidase family protein [Deltaproteobacteria bacterium]